MQFKNTKDKYGFIASIIHWTMAIIIIGLVGVGMYMSDEPISPKILKLYGIHKEFGILILMLVIVRVIWRALNTTPLLPTHLPSWQKFAAHAAHYAFYVFMLALPISGWMMTSASGLSVSFFGLFVLPNLVAPSEQLRDTLIQVHGWLAYGLIATFCAHVGAVIQHQFILKDNILRRMLPW